MKHSIHFFQRKRRIGKNFSLEQIFENLRYDLTGHFDVSKIEVPYVSSGIIKRILNTVYACFHQGDINHVTGDINYVNLLLKKRKNVLTILDCGVLQRTSGVKKKIITLIWFKLPVLRSSIVTVISEATKKDLIRHTNCHTDKIKVIYVPISDDFNPIPFEFNSRKPRILQIGAAPNKNLTRLIEAVNGLSCTLVIIGEISNENRLLLDTHKIDFENYVGVPFKELLEQYGKCDILFFASTFEGFGMPILEAQAVGRPVITSNLLSMPEVGGSAALYVNPYKVSEITAGITKICEDAEYRKQLINDGYHNVKRFDSRVITSQYIEVYNSLLNN